MVFPIVKISFLIKIITLFSLLIDGFLILNFFSILNPLAVSNYSNTDEPWYLITNDDTAMCIALVWLTIIGADYVKNKNHYHIKIRDTRKHKNRYCY